MTYSQEIDINFFLLVKKNFNRVPGGKFKGANQAFPSDHKGRSYKLCSRSGEMVLKPDIFLFLKEIPPI